METVSNVIPIITNQLTQLSEGSELSGQRDVCRVCFGSGMEIIPDKGARPCECRLTVLRDKRLAQIPAEFRSLNLATLKADKERHAKQVEAIAKIKANPTGSYIFCGRFGTGKTMLMWTLYKHACEMNQPRMVQCTLAQLLTEYRNFIAANKEDSDAVWPRLNAEELRQNDTRYSLFFDDIDKARPSEYTAEIFFEIADAVYAYQHQLVATTNLSIGKLIQHFDRADERFGGAIVRRLVEHAEIIEMF
jgi:DNA replication protein DnaC